jgi:hypothetical protein
VHTPLCLAVLVCGAALFLHEKGRRAPDGGGQTRAARVRSPPTARKKERANLPAIRARERALYKPLIIIMLRPKEPAIVSMCK